jgi:hypothetical protein
MSDRTVERPRQTGRDSRQSRYSIEASSDASNGRRDRPLWALSPMVRDAGDDDDRGMNSASQLQDRASEIVEAVRGFQAAAEEPASHAAAPDSLAALEEALQMLSASWYQLAGDASPGIVDRWRGRGSEAPSWPRFDGLSREQEARLTSTLHDVAAAFARCARACREARSGVTPIIAGRGAASRADGRRHGNEFPYFQRHERPGRRVA